MEKLEEEERNRISNSNVVDIPVTSAEEADEKGGDNIAEEVKEVDLILVAVAEANEGTLDTEDQIIDLVDVEQINGLIRNFPAEPANSIEGESLSKKRKRSKERKVTPPVTIRAQAKKKGKDNSSGLIEY